jgi:hypothetical protein
VAVALWLEKLIQDPEFHGLNLATTGTGIEKLEKRFMTKVITLKAWSRSSIGSLLNATKGNHC